MIQVYTKEGDPRWSVGSKVGRGVEGETSGLDGRDVIRVVRPRWSRLNCGVIGCEKETNGASFHFQ